MSSPPPSIRILLLGDLLVLKKRLGNSHKYGDQSGASSCSSRSVDVFRLGVIVVVALRSLL